MQTSVSIEDATTGVLTTLKNEWGTVKSTFIVFYLLKRCQDVVIVLKDGINASVAEVSL